MSATAAAREPAGLRMNERAWGMIDAALMDADALGIEVYEGVLQEESAIRAFLRRATGALGELAAAGRLRRNGPALISGAGSAWFDVVAEEFSQVDIGAPLEIVLRPGCYLSHDVGIYRSAAERINANNPVARGMEPGLQPALQVWAYVQSLPEPGRAIVALGKRDAAFDAYFTSPRYLDMVTQRFGWDTRKHIEQMTRHKLKRQLLEGRAPLRLDALEPAA